MMKPKNVQVTATKKALPTPAAAPAPTPEPKPSVVGKAKKVGKAKPVAANVSTKKARLKLTTKYTKDGCEGKVVSDINLKSGIKLGVEIKRSLPKGQYACCAQIENMKVDKLDIKIGKKHTITWKDVDFQNKKVLDLRRHEKKKVGGRTICADSFEGTFRISQ